MDSLIEHIESLIGQGRYLEAHNETNEQLLINPQDIRLKQFYALSMAKSGGLEEAESYLQPVWEQDKNDPETAGILGGIYKGIFKKTQNTKFAFLSRDVYLENFQLTGDYYTGINAATMSILIGDTGKGKKIAAQVLEKLSAIDANLWTQATKAEAYLLLKERDEAVAHYTKTREMVGNNWGQVTSIYQQLWLINQYRHVPSDILNIFKPPAIAAFAGHMIDHPNRDGVRFPEAIAPQIAEAIAKKIKELNIKIGFCSLACGADILFVEEMLKQGNEVNISLPFNKDDFIKTSVTFPDPSWLERFEAILENQSIKFITTEPYLDDNVLFALQGKVIFGASILRSSTFKENPYLLTVRSESDMQRAVGGTRALFELWPYKESSVNINTDSFHSNYTEENLPGLVQEPQKPQTDKLDRKILCLLYADIVGYQDIDESKMPYFVHNVWGEIANNYDELLLPPKFINVWGGRIFSVFNSSRSAIEFALYLEKKVKGFDWKSEGLQKEINLKLSLHIGPAYSGINPLTEQNNIYGSHMNRALEILNVTIPGTIYASEQFASVLALESPDYQYDHVGIVQLNENLGNQEIYKISQKEK